MKNRLRSTSPPPWMRSGAMNAIVSFLEQSGLDPVTVVGSEGMRVAEAFDPYRKVELTAMLKAFKKAAEVTGRNDIGLELGLTQQLEGWGPFFFLFTNAPTVGEAFKDLCRYGAVLQSQAGFQLIDNGERFGIEYTSNHPELVGWEFDNEITIALVMNIVNVLTGSTVIPTQIQFEHQPLSDIKTYKRWLGVTPGFGAANTAIIYPASLAIRQPHNANPELYKVLKRHMRDLIEAEVEQDQLHHVVRNNIGRGLTQGTATLEHIAAEIGMEPRTLQRRLKEEGTSFQVLMDEIRLSRARYYLEKTRLSITDIALELGYAEASVFVRAFKRLTGYSPNRYRQDQFR
ncbi:MAG: AraC family transcriptional regulator ligand-binding domain-containing protein [Amphritea sp.]